MSTTAAKPTVIFWVNVNLPFMCSSVGGAGDCPQDRGDGDDGRGTPPTSATSARCPRAGDRLDVARRHDDVPLERLEGDADRSAEPASAIQRGGSAGAGRPRSCASR